MTRSVFITHYGCPVSTTHMPEVVHVVVCPLFSVSVALEVNWSATLAEMSYSLFIPENILHTALFWRRTEHTSSSQLGSRCWLAARSSAMEALFPRPSPAPYPTSRESTNTIRVWAGGGRSNRGPNTALRTCEKETETQRKRLNLKQPRKKCRSRGQMRELH